MDFIGYYEDDGTLTNYFVRNHVIASNRWKDYLNHCSRKSLKPNIVISVVAQGEYVLVNGTVFESMEGEANLGHFSEIILSEEFERNHEVYLMGLNSVSFD